MLRGERRIAALFAASGLVALLVVAFWATGWLKPLELSSVDARFAIRGDLPAEKYESLALVSVDDETYADLKMRWPFPRSMHGKVIDRLKADGAKVIVMDIQFTEPTEAAEDFALYDSVAAAGNVVLATTEVDVENGKHNVLGGNESVEEADATVGNAKFPFDPGAVIRRFNYLVGGLPTLPVAAVERFTGKKIAADNFPLGSAWIDFVGGDRVIPRTAYSKVYEGKFKKGAFAGKIVVVGSTNDTVNRDVWRTSSAQLMPGPEIQANAMATILNGFPLSNSPWFLVLLLILLFAFAEPLLNLRLDPLKAFLACLFGGLAYLVLAYFVFVGGFILPVVYPLIALGLSMIAALGINFLSAAFERERTRSEFARFAPDSVVEQVLAEHGGGAKLGGKRVEATVLFSDLRGFTTFSEKLAPELVILTLNDYLSEMSEAILDNGGTLVSFMGDGIMAVFGAPVTSDDHADHALAAAREMLDRMHGFNERMQKHGMGDGFKMGIGLNTGLVMSGNVGSERRLEYTAIGDTTNTAARLEGATKGTPFQLYISGSTHDALSEEPADFVYVDEIPIRGREAGLKVWGLVEESSAAPAES